MPKVHHVKKSRKPVPQLGLPAGSEYWWWGVMMGSRGVKRYSKTPPTRSQLTQSEFLSQLYDLEDEIADANFECEGDLEDIISRIRELGEEQQSKYDNMPDGLQQGDTGQLLEERANAMESWASELEGCEGPEEVSDEDVDDAMEDEDTDADREEVRQRLEDEKLEEWRERVRDCSHGL